MNKQPKVSNYDLESYDYSVYWKQGRAYENEADKLAIKKCLNNESGDWFVDLGGSYGRLVPLYRSKYLHGFIADYSIETLKKAKKILKEQRISSIDCVGVNIYNLPFKDGTFDGVQMIRVMHHLEDPKKALTEVSRVMRSRGIFVLEFANKIHFLARVRSLLKGNFKFQFNKSPYQQPTKESKQGVWKSAGIFLNFHPKMIRQFVKDLNLNIERKLSVSNFRSGIFKRMFSTKWLVRFEDWLQRPLSLCSFGPSQYFQLRKERGESRAVGRSILEILVCPKCKKDIIKKGSDIICTKCKESFPITHGVYDMRWPRP